MNSNTPNICAPRQPDLLGRLLLIGVLSGLFIIVLAGYNTYRLSSNHILKQAEEDAANISTALSELEKQVIFRRFPDGKFRPAVTSAQIPLLDARLRPFLKPFDIVKIKIYSTDRQIIFSTDREIIGKHDNANLRLQSALNGSIDSHLERKSEFRDLADERMINVDVVETYVPIRDKDSNIIGCFEIYLNVTKYTREIANEVFFSIAALVLIITSVLAIAYLFLKKSTDQLKEAQQKLEKLAATDSLTGLFNRRHILSRSREEFVRVSRLARSHPDAPCLGFIMFDIDDFKSMNDRFGHLAGDEILAAFAAILRSNCRTYDMAGRYGGEEFLVVVPDVGSADICEIAERIRTATSEHRFLVEGNTITITVSAGIAFCRSDEPDIFAGLKRADDGLYLAKRSGKDRVRTVQDELLATCAGNGVGQ